MKRMSGPITVERIINIFFNLIVWRTLNLVINKMFQGLSLGWKKLSKPKSSDAQLTDQRLEPLDSLDQSTKSPEINDFRSSARPKNPLR